MIILDTGNGKSKPLYKGKGGPWGMNDLLLVGLPREKNSTKQILEFKQERRLRKQKLQ